MCDVMMALGEFRFSTNTATYHELRHSQQYRWQSQARLLRRPAYQFVGLGEETLEIPGVVLPHYRGGIEQIQTMRDIAKVGKPLLLVDGLGHVWGEWIIRQINETQTFFLANGQPRKQEFQLSLSHYGSDASQ